MAKKKALVLLNIGAARNKEELELFLANFNKDNGMLKRKSIFSFFSSFFSSLTKSMRLEKNWIKEEKSGAGMTLYEETEALTKKLSKLLPHYYVTFSMLYSEPFAQTVIDEIEKENISEALLLPLYPHYSKTFTANIIEDFTIKANYILKVDAIKSFYMNDIYNKTICEEIIRVQSKYNDFHLIFVAQMVTQKEIDLGEPSFLQTQEHIELLKEKLSLCAINLQSINVAYEPMVASLKPIDPSLDEMLKNFKKKKVIIYPLSYIIDNTRTLYDLNIKYRESAKKAKVIEYKVCNCVNSNDTFVKALQEIASL